MSELESLTPEQEKKIPEYLERYLKIATNTNPCDRTKAEDAVKAYYAHEKLGVPKFIWVESPEAGAKLAAQLANDRQDVTVEEIRSQAELASYGNFESYWVAFYDFISTEVKKNHDPLVELAKNIVKECGVYWTFESTVVMTERPIEVHIKDGRLHNDTGFAMLYKDGTGIVAINGERKRSLMDLAISEEMDK